MTTVLLTGFEPFDGGTRNPSQEIVERLAGETTGGARLLGAVLPVVFGTARRDLERQIATLRPTLVLCLGQATGRSGITPERVAVNRDDARIPDNAGQMPRDLPVVPGGPPTLLSTVPVEAIVAALVRRGIPAAVSESAGAFVCNHVFYGLLQLLDSGAYPRTRGGFIHVPWLPEQAPAGRPSLPLEVMVTAVRTAIEVCLREPAHGVPVG